MTSSNPIPVFFISLLIVVGLVVTSSVPVANAQVISYDDAESFLTTMEAAVEAAGSPAVDVQEHDDSLDEFDPNELSSLMDYVSELAEGGEGTSIVDRKFQMVGERLSVCLGTEHDGGSSVAGTTFCQDLENNLLNRVILKDGDGNVLGRYELN